MLEVRDLSVRFPVLGGVFQRPKAFVHAVDGVSFGLKPRSTLGLVGESGCGKTTIGRTIMTLLKPTSGQVLIDGTSVHERRGAELFLLRRTVQMIFQDPFDSLNARHPVGYILEEPLIIHRTGDRFARRKEVERLLDIVGLSRDAMTKYPHEFSGGQRQRIGIARALALKPQYIVCDEPVSALDVSVQSQVLNLLNDLQKEFGLAYLFIAHNLAVVRYMSEHIAVMYLGRIVEVATGEGLYRDPLHPYTEALLQAIPEPERKTQFKAIQGEVPSALNPPKGCHFHTRCPYVMDRCRTEQPPLKKIDEHRSVACHLR